MSFAIPDRPSDGLASIRYNSLLYADRTHSRTRRPKAATRRFCRATRSTQSGPRLAPLDPHTSRAPRYQCRRPADRPTRPPHAHTLPDRWRPLAARPLALRAPHALPNRWRPLAARLLSLRTPPARHASDAVDRWNAHSSSHAHALRNRRRRPAARPTLPHTPRALASERHRRLHRLPPAAVQPASPFLVHARLEAAVHLPQRDQLLATAPDADAQPR